jgi:hypothetical protein
MAARARDLVATPGHLRRRQRLLANAVNRLGPGAAPPPPTHEQIALRAYEIFQQRAGNQGDPEADWLEAERELLAAAAAACGEDDRFQARSSAGRVS